MCPRRYLMRPAFCKVLATKETLVRLTPSIWLKNSWVKSTWSDCVRSRMRRSHRHMRASTVWPALQPADCWAWASSTCSWRTRTEAERLKFIGDATQGVRADDGSLTCSLHEA